MESISKLSPQKRRDVAYYRQRQKNRVFTELVRFFAEEAERHGITKKDLANALSKDPAQISRWLSAPSNFELDTLSDILLALGAEMDHKIVRFKDRLQPNFVHPLLPNTQAPSKNAGAVPPRTTSTATVVNYSVGEASSRGIRVESADTAVEP